MFENCCRQTDRDHSARYVKKINTSPLMILNAQQFFLQRLPSLQRTRKYFLRYYLLLVLVRNREKLGASVRITCSYSLIVQQQSKLNGY